MHPHKSSALGYASAASAAHIRVYGACAAEAAVSEALGLSVSGCTRESRITRYTLGRAPYYAGPRARRVCEVNLAVNVNETTVSNTGLDTSQSESRKPGAPWASN